MNIYQRWFLGCLCSLFFSLNAFGQEIWSVGKKDGQATDFALWKEGYQAFLSHDFGWEDKYFLVGVSKPATDFPFILPGPADAWGGTSGTAGIRSHFLNFLFDVKAKPLDGDYRLLIDLLDTPSENAPELKVTVNGHIQKVMLANGGGDAALKGDLSAAKAQQIVVEVPNAWIQQGGNAIQLTTLQGSWLMFDHVGLQGPATALEQPKKAYLRSAKAASYTLRNGNQSYQPLLLDLEHISSRPDLVVKLDNKNILSKKIEQGRYLLEAPMPAVSQPTESQYELYLDGKLWKAGTVLRKPQPIAGPAHYVDTQLGSAHSRWMIAPGPWMPFSMVKLSPDNQNYGWQAGYDPTIESIGCFSHLHEWTVSGLGMMPTQGALQIQTGDEHLPDSGYRSRFDKQSEKSGIGLYSVHLTDHDIQAELTSTTRAGFQRYTFNKGKTGRVMIDLQIPTEYWYNLEDFELRKMDDYTIEGYSDQKTPNTWAGGIDQEYKVHFVLKFDQPIKHFGTWKNDVVSKNSQEVKGKNVADAGAYVTFDLRKSRVVQVKSGISFVSIDNARENLAKEIDQPFGWDFDAVVEHQHQVWNDLLSRVNISSDDAREKMRFYSSMYRSFCERNTFSDVNGQWRDASERVQTLERPDDLALGCDAFWNTFWNLNQVWNLVAPEWSNRWVRSQLAMYKTDGWLAKGPAGMEYIPVMVAEHEIPMMIGAYQMGIRDYDPELMFEAVKKMQETPAQQVGGGFAGNRDLETYLKHHYVPYDEGRFSNSLEYSFDDWTVGQFAKSLGKMADYERYNDRGYWWKNVIDPATGFARMRDAEGNWKTDFDPFKSGANHHYVEGNAWQLTFFVPQDVPALAEMIGKKEFVKRLNWGFEESEKWRYNAPNDLYWDYPVIQGNQQSMHFAWLFNYVGRPWETQRWSRSIMDRYYGFEPANAYLGDEDQGQMSAWFVMNAIGLFQIDGGTQTAPVYEIGSPLFEEVTIDLGEQFGRGKSFTIKAHNTSRINKYVQSAKLNGQPLDTFFFSAESLLQGGTLELEMGPMPNKKWGLGLPERLTK